MKSSYVLLGILAITIAAFSPVLQGEFLAYDDELLILDNPTAHGLSATNIVNALSTYDPELYIPLTLLTYQIEWSMVGANPLLYHITNLALHLLSVSFVFLILRRFFDLKIAAVCTLLFAIHPLQTEAVGWLAGRKDLLASMFFLASTHTYLSNKRKISIALFLCGLLSKVSVFPLPLCLILIDWVQENDIRMKDKLPYFALSVIFVTIAFIGKSTQASGLLTAIILSPAGILLTTKHIIWPVGLTILYPFVDAVSLTNTRVLSGAALMILMVAICAVTWKKNRMITFGIVWFILMLSPSLLNVQRGGELGVPDIYLTSDRYAYLALLGPMFLLGTLYKKIREEWAIGLVIMCCILTFRQSWYWQNSNSLFERVIHVGQPSHVAYTNVAGFTARNGNLEEAESLFEKSLEIRTTTRVLFNLAQIKTHLGKKNEALALYRALLEITPEDNEARSKMNALL